MMRPNSCLMSTLLFAAYINTAAPISVHFPSAGLGLKVPSVQVSLTVVEMKGEKNEGCLVPIVLLWYPNLPF